MPTYFQSIISVVTQKLPRSFPAFSFQWPPQKMFSEFISNACGITWCQGQVASWHNWRFLKMKTLPLTTAVVPLMEPSSLGPGDNKSTERSQNIEIEHITPWGSLQDSLPFSYESLGRWWLKSAVDPTAIHQGIVHTQLCNWYHLLLWRSNHYHQNPGSQSQERRKRAVIQVLPLK